MNVGSKKRAQRSSIKMTRNISTAYPDDFFFSNHINKAINAPPNNAKTVTPIN